MTAILILLLTLLQFFTGFGIITLCRLRLKPGLLLSLSVLLGIAVFSLIPFLLQLFYIPLTAPVIFSSLVIACILCNLKFDTGLADTRLLLKNTKFRVKLYEIPALAVMIFIIVISVWKCYYFPPTPRDLTSGTEAIAEYAVREKTMINSLFTVNLESTNNPFKSPFITSLQIIYKYAGFPFGQLWLSGVFISFIVFLYHAIGSTLHKLPAGIFVLLFLAIPEMYAYTFMVLYDYSNAVFFFLALFFLFEFFKNRQTNNAVMAGLLMGIATYIRSETLVLACLFVPLIAWQSIKNKRGLKQLIITTALFVIPAVVFYILTVPVFINNYLPVPYNIAGQINFDLANLQPLYNRFVQINTRLLFGNMGTAYYGYFVFIFLALLILELIVKRRLSAAAKNWLYVVAVVYLGYSLLGFLLPLLDIDNSTKRGLFKLFPAALFYLVNNSLVTGLSGIIKRWENPLRPC